MGRKYVQLRVAFHAVCIQQCGSLLQGAHSIVDHTLVYRQDLIADGERSTSRTEAGKQA